MLLHIDILVNDYDVGLGDSLVHPLQVNLLHQICETKMQDNDRVSKLVKLLFIDCSKQIYYFSLSSFSTIFFMISVSNSNWTSLIVKLSTSLERSLPVSSPLIPTIPERAFFIYLTGPKEKHNNDRKGYNKMNIGLLSAETQILHVPSWNYGIHLQQDRCPASLMRMMSKYRISFTLFLCLE